MARIEPYISRVNQSGGANDGDTEFLFMPVDVMNFDINKRAVDIGLPGNDEGDISGTSGTNFILDLGAFEVSLRISGTLVPVDSSELPSLGTNETYIKYTSNDGEDQASPSQTTGSAPNYTGEELRNSLAQVVASASNIDDYTTFQFGWPAWGASIDSNSTNQSGDTVGNTIDGTDYRVFEGIPGALRTEERAGENGQYTYSFDWSVGPNE